MDFAEIIMVIEKHCSREEQETLFGDAGDFDDELEMAGLDRDEFEFMDEDDRREALVDAGLDPDDYDF